MDKLIKYVDSDVSALMGKQANRLDIKTLPKFFEYLIRHFAILYHTTGQEGMRKIVADTLAEKPTGQPKPKMLRGLEENIVLMFVGYNDFMKCGGQAEFLRYLILQHKIHEESMDIEDLKKIVRSYVQ